MTKEICDTCQGKFINTKIIYSYSENNRDKTKYYFCSEKCLKNGMIEECGYCHDKFPKSIFVIKLIENNTVSYFCDPDCLFTHNRNIRENHEENNKNITIEN